MNLTAAQFNAKYKPGIPVRYYQLVKERDKFLVTWTRDEAWTLGHGEPVVSIMGMSGGVSLEHVELREDGPQDREKMIQELCELILSMNTGGSSFQGIYMGWTNETPEKREWANRVRQFASILKDSQ